MEDEQGKPKVDSASNADGDGGDEGEMDDDEEEEEVIPDNLSDPEEETPPAKKAKKSQGGDEGSTSQLLTEEVKRRAPSSLPPLLSRLSERQPEKLNYIGVSFGATPKLLRFWKRAGYLPVYLRQTMVGSISKHQLLIVSKYP